MYESLTELIPDCDVTSEYGTWVDSSNGKGTSDNQPTMPHVSPGPAMRRYEQRVYAFVEEHQELGFYKSDGQEAG